ncbi:hypothetical protein B5E41_29075 [Rhizobium esperanzae]|uniref:YHYH domain-containing protein n=1 Tax=Rhizobium esperanzae TaxID=1967781 RepID=A0A246DLH2_9HYPH|nr:hypothetical protein B5E41_29075 [Rhizobium esperanzae]
MGGASNSLGNSARRGELTRTHLLPSGLEMKIAIAIAILVVWSTFSLSVSAASAHSGGTDSNGCHTNHKTGDYHCH